MSKNRVRIGVLLALVAITVLMIAQDKKPLSPPGQATMSFADGKTVTIDYSRPSMRGRKIMGDLVPFDKVWRTGANAATSLKTDVNLSIGGTAVPAGSYTLYTLPKADGWMLIVNKQTGQWGTKYDQSQDLARIPMKVMKASSPVEQFTISFVKSGSENAVLKMEWENTVASVDVKEQK